MALFIQAGETILWAPTLQAGQLFARQVRDLEWLIQQPSGLSEIISDEVELDPPVFQAFVEGCLGWLACQSDPAFYLMCHGCLAILAALFFRRFERWPAGLTQNMVLLEAARQMLATLPEP